MERDRGAPYPCERLLCTNPTRKQRTKAWKGYGYNVCWPLPYMLDHDKPTEVADTKTSQTNSPRIRKGLDGVCMCVWCRVTFMIAKEMVDDKQSGGGGRTRVTVAVTPCSSPSGS